MIFKVLLLIVPLSSYGMKIHIDVLHKTVDVSGSDDSIISDRDRGIFKINDDQLREYIFKTEEKQSLSFQLFMLTSGEFPFIDGKYYNYPHQIIKDNIQRHIKLTSAKITRSSIVPEIVSVKELMNDSPYNSTFSTDIKEEKQNTISHTWRKGGDFISELSVEVGVEFAKTSATISYSENWGEDHTKSFTSVVGSSSKVDVKLMPGQAAKATLTSERVNMEIAVDYTTYLTGTLGWSYHYPYKNHYYHYGNIKDLLEKVNLPHTITSQEIIKLDIFTYGRVKIEKMKIAKQDEGH